MEVGIVGHNGVVTPRDLFNGSDDAGSASGSTVPW